MIIKEFITKLREEELPVPPELARLSRREREAEATASALRPLVDKRTLDLFMSMPLWEVPGLGPRKAADLWLRGVRPSNLARHRRLLPEVTQLALDWKPLPRIPRETVKKIYDRFVPPGYRRACEIVGSYRRGRPHSGDVDILYCGEDFERFTADLAAFHKDRIAIYARGTARVSSYFRYAPGRSAGVDVWLCRPDYRAAMRLYATGSKLNNVRMRFIAKRRGLKLNQYGLFDQKGRPYGDPLRTERDIYRALGMKYREPSER